MKIFPGFRPRHRSLQRALPVLIALLFVAAPGARAWLANSFFWGANRKPSGLSLSQTPNDKTFTVSWAAGKGNGGSGGCKIQYQNSGGAWTSVASPATLNCDAVGSAAGTITLPGDGWYGSSWSSVPMRLVRVSDGRVMGGLGSLTCSPTGASGSPTPTIDEDCDDQWDNSNFVSNIVSGCPSNSPICIGFFSWSNGGCSGPPAFVNNPVGCTGGVSDPIGSCVGDGPGDSYEWFYTSGCSYDNGYYLYH